MIKELKESSSVTLVKAIAPSSCIKGSIVVISIWAHIIIIMYNAKEKEIRIKNKTQNQKGANKGEMPIFFLGMLKTISLNLLKSVTQASFSIARR